MGCLNLTGRGLSVIIALPCLLAVAVLAGCSAKSDTAAAAPDPAKEQEALMNQGMEALNARNNATEAAALFRKVLDLNPTHYGATYQLAAALDAAGKPEEAIPYWAKALAMAEKSNDQTTISKARARLQKLP
jgi:Tfp pilus assembly protein PilF